MKVLVVISMYLACAVARGSGPYLPRDWKPEGPAFFLPSEVAKTSINSQIDIIFPEPQASGSDFLREYGPPKLQEVSQDISHQGLPDVVNEQLFAQAIVQTDGVEKSNVLIEVTKQKAEVNSVKEGAPVIESQKVVEITTSAAESETATNIEQDTAQENSEFSTSDSFEAVTNIAYVVEPTLASVTYQEVTNESSAPLVSQIADEKTDVQKKVVQQQVSKQSDSEVEDSASVNAIIIEELTKISDENSLNQVFQDNVVETQQVAIQQAGSKQPDNQVEELVDSTKTGSQQESTGVVSNQQTITSVESSGLTVSKQAEMQLEVTSAVEKRVQTIEEQVKNIEQVVQNIPDVIVSLENEIKSQQIQVIQDAPGEVQESLGSLVQVPEGFLEYGPPGFTEYGPPKEDLKDTIEEKTPEKQSQSNEIRKRRSPKWFLATLPEKQSQNNKIRRRRSPKWLLATLPELGSSIKFH